MHARSNHSKSSVLVLSSLAWYVFSYRKHVTVIIVLLVFSRALYATVEYPRILPLDKCAARALTLSPLLSRHGQFNGIVGGYS